MTPVRQFLIVFFALCAGLFAVPSGSLAASVDRTCQSGKALVAAGEPVEATKLFVSVLKRSPGNRCAQEALKSVTAKRDAKKPTTNPAAASAACARGSALNKADKGEKALAEFLVAAAKDPANDCWSKGIDSLRPDVQQEVETVASSYRPLLTLAVELLVGGALLAYLLLALLARIPGIRRAYVIRTVRYPRLDVADPDAEALGDDKPWSSMVAVRLRGRVGARRPLGKDLYTLGARSTVATTLGGLNDVSGYAKTLVTLIALAEKLLPRRSYTVETVLEPAGGSSGLSITVAFRDDQGVRGTETFEAGEYYAVPSSASGPAA
ncbi:MAG: hypothetical protein Q7T55_03325, partial [Solirubrobacteraceae bacterium]|nr:hypothetical protein [Solirubrobacteraceae bacterium]